MALRQGLLLSRHHRCLIGPLWAESPVTHTAEAAMAGNCPLLPVYGGHGGRVWVACEKVRTRCLFVSSWGLSPSAWMSLRCCCCCPLAVGGGAAPQGEEPELSPEPHKESGLKHERSHLKDRERLCWKQHAVWVCSLNFVQCTNVNRPLWRM